MNPIKYELFDSDPNDFFTPDYSQLTESFGLEEIFTESYGSYQGDTTSVFRDGKRFGYLNFGWGSCSGCDSLQACDKDKGKIEALRDSLFEDIAWHDSKESMISWLKEKDWEGDYSGAERRQIAKNIVKDLEAL